MLDFRLFLPRQVDNTYVGNKLALWFFYLLTAVTLWRSQHHLFAEDGGAQSIATIPLDTYSSEASSTVIGIFALWGLSQLVIGFIYLVVCFRYKALVPLMYFLGVIEYGMRAFYIGAYKPIETAGDAPGALINLPFMLLFTLMLVLSLWRKSKLDS
ncbi:MULTISPECIES: hypothetical protein [Vibrio harveyi group]|jgi:hypothetical protein|uniref:hypothetical protein n=1 Tax=Vibrio harveyi group TaxID=717610 RepID=UPI0028958728|nr:conserved membrane hypothetical protein [Vibrio rotiferianus]